MTEETILNKILIEIINIKAKQEDMQKQMNEGFARLDAKIEHVRQELHEEIQGVKQGLESKIDNLSKELQEVKELAQYNKKNGYIIKQVCQKKFAEYDRRFIELDDIYVRKRVH